MVTTSESSVSILQPGGRGEEIKVNFTNSKSIKIASVTKKTISFD